MRTHKYGAIPKVIDGIRFASTKEARRYQELKLMEKAGEIEALALQPRFPLGIVDDRHQFQRVTTACTGNLYIGDYVADFSYWDVRHKRNVIEDVKGFKTPLYRWKKKHFEGQYGLQITEI